jgi:hypothetical protein
LEINLLSECHFERSEKSGGASRLLESNGTIFIRFFAALKMTVMLGLYRN